MRGLNFVVLLFFQQVFVFAYEDPSLLIDNIWTVMIWKSDDYQ